MKLDLHLHTSRRSPDSVIDPREVAERGRLAGLDGVVITEHDQLWPEDELDELRAAASGFLILAGVEVTARDGDLLCYGVTSLARLKRGTRWRDVCAEVHAQGGAVVAAHPYRWGQDFDALVRKENAELDGVELVSNNMDSHLRRLTAQYHANHPKLAGLGNSDAHEPAKVGFCHTVFAEPVRDIADVVRQIKAGQTRAVNEAEAKERR